VKQDQVVSCTTGTVQHAADLVFRKELAEKLDNYRIVFTESIKEQVIAIGKTHVQVMSHVLYLFGIWTAFRAKPKKSQSPKYAYGKDWPLVSTLSSPP
jgi:hypothetical protein